MLPTPILKSNFFLKENSKMAENFFRPNHKCDMYPPYFEDADHK